MDGVWMMKFGYHEVIKTDNGDSSRLTDSIQDEARDLENQTKVNEWCVPLIGWGLIILCLIVWLWGFLI